VQSTLIRTSLLRGQSALRESALKRLSKSFIQRFGWGSLGALERAKRARAATWEKVRLAEEERQKAAGLVQQAYSGGYEHPIEVGGAVFTPLVLSPYGYGGWHGGCGNEQWISRMTHTCKLNRTVTAYRR
jgi:hypothetical protein